MAPNKSIKIYLSCSPEDGKLEIELAKQLSLLNLNGVAVWRNGNINPGVERSEEIENWLNSAHIILLLISADFFASDEHNRLYSRAKERHEAREACVIPVLLRACAWKSELQALPSNGIPITSWPNQDEAFKEVAEEIGKAIQNKSDYISLPQKDEKRFKIPWRSLSSTLSSSVVITILVLFIRFIGALQPFELLFYDQMMRLKFLDNSKDDKLLLIQITEADLKKYPGKGASLDDKNLSELLTKLIKLNAQTIGLDLYRNFAAKEGSDLQRLLKKEPRLFAICKVSDENAESEGTAPPPEVSQSRIGFSDLLPDEDNVVRRQMLQMDNTKVKQDDNCFKKQKVMDSFSFKLVQHYLSATNQEYKCKGNDCENAKEIKNLASENAVLQRIYNTTPGPYQSMFSDLSGYQVLLNYRRFSNSYSLENNIANIKTVTEALESKDEELKELVNGKIVLIGTKLEDIDSKSPTPFRNPPVQGLILQAQSVSQLLSAVLDKRPLIKVWSIWHEMLWIFVWSLAGGTIAYLCPSKRYLIISGGTSFISLYLICLIFFISDMKHWIPFVPPTLTLLGSGGVIVLIKFKARKVLLKS